MGKLAATQIGGVTFLSGMGKFLASLPGYLTFGWATRKVEGRW